LLVFAERDHLIEDAAVLLQEKIFRLEIFDGGVEGLIIEQDGARMERSASRFCGSGVESGFTGIKRSLYCLFFAL